MNDPKKPADAAAIIEAFEASYPAWIEEGMFNGVKLDPKYAIPASAI